MPGRVGAVPEQHRAAAGEHRARAGEPARSGALRLAERARPRELVLGRVDEQPRGAELRARVRASPAEIAAAACSMRCSCSFSRCSARHAMTWSQFRTAAAPRRTTLRRSTGALALVMCTSPSVAYSPRGCRAASRTPAARPPRPARRGSASGRRPVRVAAGVGAVDLEGRVRRVAVLGHPQRARRTRARRATPELAVAPHDGVARARAGARSRRRTCGARPRRASRTRAPASRARAGRIRPPNSTVASGALALISS